MGRVKGIAIGSTYDVAKRQPLDARMLVTAYEDLINPDTWTTNESTSLICYNTQLTDVNSNDMNAGIYFLVDRTRITKENYESYLSAKENNQDTASYFSMWLKVADIAEIGKLRSDIAELADRLDDIDDEDDSIQVFEKFADFPTVGDRDVLYVALDKSSSYIYSTRYLCVGSTQSSGFDVSIINGGNAQGELPD